MTLSSITRVWIGTFFAALLIGAFALNMGSAMDLPTEMIVHLRLPRVVLALGVGAGLAVAGVVLQTLFSNPLCEPYTLGISSGAALGAVLGVSFGLSSSVLGLSGAGFLGALFFTGILVLIAYRVRRARTAILLSGVMLGFLGSSGVAIWMSLSSPAGMQSAVGWLFGDLSRARLFSSGFVLFSVFFLSVSIWRRWKELDALLMGEQMAESLGVGTGTLRRRMILLTSLLVAICVSAAGMIGFVGLVVPHLARMRVGSLHRMSIPVAALWGAIALVGSDLVARTLASPYELPVGIVTAFLGAPVFLTLMLRRRA